ncbi:hypothetical protein [Priestia filamentosa]|uniref:hypothetical protein n=1 Tax=Priestia filamentosa TaxID=1402861 RepID=UPI000A08D846|nr:hypothetical protein [Priestia filamentosa]OXS69825.1 hypothetical protein B1B01_12805 [Priestia filamentosa]SMF36562.1 hypothetical protein SAMN06296056_1021141 [Priestia filamentosa]
MKKYLGLVSVIISIITSFISKYDWRVGIAGIVIGLILAIKAPRGVWKYVAYVVLALCILLFLFLVVMGILISAVVEMG